MPSQIVGSIVPVPLLPLLSSDPSLVAASVVDSLVLASPRLVVSGDEFPLEVAGPGLVSVALDVDPEGPTHWPPTSRPKSLYRRPDSQLSSGYEHAPSASQTPSAATLQSLLSLHTKGAGRQPSPKPNPHPAIHGHLRIPDVTIASQARLGGRYFFSDFPRRVRGPCNFGGAMGGRGQRVWLSVAMGIAMGGCYSGADGSFSGDGAEDTAGSEAPQDSSADADESSSSGDGGDDADDSDSDDEPVAGCEERTLGASPMRRLTRLEYDNTIRDLLHDTSAPSHAFVEDEAVAGFAANAVAPLSATQLDQYFSAAEDLAATAVSERWDDVVGCGAEDDGCLDGFVERFAKLGLAREVLRRRGRHGLRDGAGNQIRQVLDGGGAFC